MKQKLLRWVLKLVRRQLAEVYWQSVPLPDCTWKKGLTL